MKVTEAVSRDRQPIRLLGVGICPLTSRQLLDRIADYIEEDAHAVISHLNVHGLNLAGANPWMSNFFNESDIVFCDGAGIVLGARILGHQVPERITYADWMWQLAEFSAQKGFSLFFLGAEHGVAEKAACELKKRFSNLQILGTHHGYFDKTLFSRENEAVIHAINAVKPDILVVGFGMPLQERWLMENWRSIDSNVALTGGAVFDYVAGELRRAPSWMTKNSLEWLGRLIIEPRRLWRRYLIGNPVFLWRVLRQRLFGSHETLSRERDGDGLE